MDKKIKVFVLSDHPLSPSGVGTQTRYMIEALLNTGKFKFVCYGGAIKHDDYRPAKTEQWGDDWIILPVDGYGSEDQVRATLRNERPDIIWFMTDPRFWGWLWNMEDEIRPLVPMVYYHVWDNYPYPKFNAMFYDSTDVIVSISKLTDNCVRNVSPNVETHHIPHAVDQEVFKKLDEETIQSFREHNLTKDGNDPNRFVLFWNNRNARRKQSGTLIYWFKDFLDEVGHDKAMLLMHTDPKDIHGQDLEAIIHELGLNKGQVMLSTEKIAPHQLSLMYNMADITVNISDAEGFGLATLESLSCETPILVNMTGGLQEQVTDGENWFGEGLEPASKAIIGSQEVPFIYEDRIAKKDFLDALKRLFNLTPEERKELGAAGRKHVDKNYSFDTFNKSWVDLMLSVHERYGSWETRKNYEPWEMIEIS